MICNKPLTPQQKSKSQRNYCYYNAMNGVSYMCLGETILLLLAVKIKCPDWVISTLGSMIYFGFLMLPLGKTAAARLGGAGAQSFFWVCRNIVAVVVGISAIFSYFGYQTIAIILLLTGSFFFYGFRAAGVVMSQPLVGEVADTNGSGKLLAVANGIFFFFRMATLIGITLIVNFNDSMWTLVIIILFGASCGITSSKFLSNIDETTAIRDSAKKSVTADIRWGLRDAVMRKQLWSGFVCNLAWIMTIPIASLAVKRGYNADDSDVLVFTISFSAGCCIMSFVGGYVAKMLGPRKQLMIAQIIMILTSAVWIILPEKLPYIYMLFHFFLLGTAGIWGLNASPHYFLQTVPQPRQVGASMLLSVVTGVIAGVTGILLTGFILETVPNFTSTPLNGYKLYFAITTILLIPGYWAFKALTPLPVDKRKLSKLLLRRIIFFIYRRY